MNQRFTPPGWLKNPHLQTILPALLRTRPHLPLREEPLELPDGDVLRLVWGPEVGGPLVVILHGLGGGAESGYVLGLLGALREHGVSGVVMQFRGAGGWANRLDRFYHAAAWEDLEETVAILRRRNPTRPLGVAGYSLGASIILNWLAARGDSAPVVAAATASPPFDLDACATHIDRGFARIYQRDLLRSLKRMVRNKYRYRAQPPVDLDELARVRTLREFDDRLTAPLHGFGSAANYYARASCGQRLHAVARPTLLLHAEDDPFVPSYSIPAPAALSAVLELELYPHGGHVGFVASPKAGGMRWLDQRLAAYLAAHLVADPA